ncbi:ATP-binding protein [uncultured Thiodictyon sp.]|uniref:ATP-binding protein n=1 Tax=uncultured Thiodictyon sp. TaxID=1846217 RepID=UPI0025EF8410|nr:ATP-binding protein [uncultured Thiodictyon sp.]
MARAWYISVFAPPLTDYLSGPVFQSPFILLLMLTWLLIALSQVIMNAQRLEYDLRMAQGQLEQARTAAEAANTAKTEFLTHMSHEIRTPLNAVLGLAQVLNREPLRDHQRDMVQRIQDAGQSLLAILNDVLDLSKIEAGQLRMEAAPFDPALLLAHIDTLMGPSARAKGLALRVAAPAIPPGRLVGDALRLQQVLLNLIGNAIKFTEQGEVTLRVAAVETDASAVRLRFAVCDRGIGIAPAALQQLFTPFTQADTGIMRRFGGTGLGLAISKHLVDLLGGEIGVESALGWGSTFWFELPFARAAETSVSASAPDAVAQPPTLPRLTGAHLLVVDDSAMNRDLVERVLQMVALLLIFITAKTDEDSETQALNAGGVDFIHKPLKRAVVRTRVRLHGDLVLQAVAKRMTGSIRAADSVGRIGGDEFVVLLTDVQDEEQAVKVAEGIGEALRQPFILDGKTLSLSSSIGLACYPDHGSDAIELARHADEAMYQAKESGRNRLQVFQPDGFYDKITGVYNRPFLEN